MVKGTKLGIGDQVELIIRSRDDTIYSQTGFRDWTLRGRVITRFSWADADTICLQTSCTNVPNRVVSLSNILSVKKISLTDTVAVEPQVPTWTVAGSKGSVYNVKLQDRKYSCSCPGFTFRNHCRHVEQIRNQKVAA